ncbi:MAG: hypothetical protein JSV80_02540, partial [Acidobacteriota bacterium]
MSRSLSRSRGNSLSSPEDRSAAFDASSPPSPVQGFILQHGYRIQDDRAVVHLYGKLKTGESFQIRDHRARPHFFVRAADAHSAGALPGATVHRPDRTTMDGQPVARVDLAFPSDVPRARETLRARGVFCYEADVPFVSRFLIDRAVRSSVEIAGESHSLHGIDRVFDDPQLTSSDWTPSLSVLSIDIETDPSGRQIVSLALDGESASEVLLVAAAGTHCPPDAVRCASERELLVTFGRRLKQLDPDVITGWNVIDFDLAVLARIAARLSVPRQWGRAPGALRLRSRPAGRGSSFADLPGRLVLDGIQLL